MAWVPYQFRVTLKPESELRVWGISGGLNHFYSKETHRSLCGIQGIRFHITTGLNTLGWYTGCRKCAEIAANRGLVAKIENLSDDGGTWHTD